MTTIIVCDECGKRIMNGADAWDVDVDSPFKSKKKSKSLRAHACSPVCVFNIVRKWLG